MSQKPALNLTIFHKGLILVSLPLVFEIVFAVILVGLLQQADAELKREARSKKIITFVDVMRSKWTDVSIAVAFYTFSHSPVMKERFYRVAKEIRNLSDDAQELVKGNKREEQIVARLQATTEPSLSAMEKTVESDDPAFGRFFDPTGRRRTKNPMRDMDYLAGKLMEIETDAASRITAERTRTRQMIQQALFGGLALNVILTILLTFYLSRSITNRLALVTDNTQRLAKRQPLNPLVGGTDEIALLDKCLHTSANQLTDLENFKRDMMSMVSHELRTPLSSLVMVLKLLSEGALGQMPEKALLRIRAAETNTDRLIRLINDLLDIDRMQAGKLEMSFKEVSFDLILDQSLDAVRDLAAKAEISIVRNGSAGIMTLDQDRLVQVVVNLLSNAIKYSSAGSSVIMELIDTAESVTLKVIDQGRGIPAEFKDKVFEKFQQVDQSDHREKTGSGLGLAICKAIIEQHQGQIGVESEAGKGSTFWFKLPKLSADIFSSAEESTR